MIRRSLGEWWTLRYPIAVPPRPNTAEDRSGAPADADGATAPVPAAGDNNGAPRRPDETVLRPRLWWTGGALGSALRAGRWSAWLAIGAGLVAAIVVARAS